MTENDAETMVISIRRRLVAVADNPPYRYVNTSAKNKARFELRKRTFEGYSDAEIETTETDLNIRFPLVYRAYLRIMGISNGDLFCGSNLASISQCHGHRTFAEELLAENDAELALDENVIVFIEHHGYTFCYFNADGTFDSPIYQFVEGESKAKLCSSGFAEMLDAEVSMIEENNANSRESGGYFLTVEGDGVSENHPARASGIRPLDLTDAELEHYIATSSDYDVKPWWRFW